MAPLSALGVVALLGFGAALVASFAAVRPAALGFALAALAALFFVRADQPLAVFLLALVASLVTMRTIDLVRDPSSFTFGRRLWHLFAVFDTRLATARPPGFEGRLTMVALAWGAVVWVALWVLMGVANEHSGPAHFALRWGACAVAAVAMFESIPRLGEVGYALFGLRPPQVHDSPWASRSVREFWGVRWNKAVGRWLRENCHEPLRRRGRPGAGVAAAFLASAVLHWYLVLPSLGLYWSGVMGLFFLIQVGLMALERGLGVARWRPVWARVWTVGALLAAAPLFCEPVARLFDPLSGR